MESIYFRYATEADLPRIVEIYNESIPAGMSTADTIPVSVESKRAWMNSHSPAKRPLLIAENEEHTIVGWLNFHDFKSRPAYDGTVEIGVYISSAYHGKGIGKRLLDYGLEIAPKSGIRSVVALIFEHNEASIRLFKQAGFAQWGLLPEVCLMAGVYKNVVILGKQLQV